MFTNSNSQEQVSRMRSVGSRCFAPSVGQTKNTKTHSVVTDLFNVILKIRDRKRRITNKHLQQNIPSKVKSRK